MDFVAGTLLMVMARPSPPVSPAAPPAASPAASVAASVAASAAAPAAAANSAATAAAALPASASPASAASMEAERQRALRSAGAEAQAAGEQGPAGRWPCLRCASAVHPGAGRPTGALRLPRPAEPWQALRPIMAGRPCSLPAPRGTMGC